MSKIKAVTYEESRLEFFQNAVEHLERRLKYWTSPKRIYDRSWYEVDEACADIGKKMSYIKDAIEALKPKQPRMTNLEKALRGIKKTEDRAAVLNELFNNGVFLCCDCEFDDEAVCIDKHDCFDSFLKWAFAEDDDDDEL